MSLSEPVEGEIEVIQEGFLNPPVTEPLGPIFTELPFTKILNSLVVELGGVSFDVEVVDPPLDYNLLQNCFRIFLEMYRQFFIVGILLILRSTKVYTLLNKDGSLKVSLIEKATGSTNPNMTSIKLRRHLSQEIGSSFT